MKKLITFATVLLFLSNTSLIFAQNGPRSQKEMPTIESHLKELNELLSLNDEQLNSIKLLVQDRMLNNRKLRAQRMAQNQQMEAQKRKQMKDIRKDRYEQNKAFTKSMKELLSAEQFSKWQAYRDQKMGARMREKREQRNPNNR